MTERDRLIGLLQSILYDYELDHKAESIADDLLDKGVVVPPCKVGDTVWYITGIHNTLVKGAKVEEIYYGEAEFAFRLCHDYTYFTLKEVDVFPTKEEAEKALKRSKG